MRTPGSVTKQAILVAARERFAADGYERATIRAIAADASIDPAMVIRYFGSKEKLFAAAADFQLLLPDVGTLPREELGARLVGHFLTRWQEDETLLALLRAGATNDAAAARLREIFADQVGPVVARLVPDPREAARRAGLVATQILGFALCRYALKLPPVVALSDAEVLGWLGPTVQRYLLGD
ncbi:TetR/AcrR family transcriptional regulator [Hamadaea tsunoensis]|uniref:TetR/AcrR family transcriptional regulator n=1 Tax=Hamadaea tsunoensis TaxID=53368 RepID=UPI0004132F08|nr:TetR family transcriptional regulator [Hamadaea tsunoensis]